METTPRGVVASMGSVKELLCMISGSKVVRAVDERIREMLKKEASPRSVGSCLVELGRRGLLNAVGRAVRLIVVHPSLHAWRELIQKLIHPHGGGTGVKAREANTFSKLTWGGKELTQMGKAMQRALGTDR